MLLSYGIGISYINIARFDENIIFLSRCVERGQGIQQLRGQHPRQQDEQNFQECGQSRGEGGESFLYHLIIILPL